MRPASPRERRLNRVQNLAIVLLALSAMLLFANLPMFGALSDQSLLELARDRIRRETMPAETETSDAASLAFPVRMVYTNGFARLGADGGGNAALLHLVGKGAGAAVGAGIIQVHHNTHGSLLWVGKPAPDGAGQCLW